jgi:hypothetical protein
MIAGTPAESIFSKDIHLRVRLHRTWEDMTLEQSKGYGL